MHAIDADAALGVLDSRRGGLTKAEADRLLAEYGPNEPAHAKPESSWALLRRQVVDPMISVLVVAGAIALVLGEHVDAAVVFAVVVVNALIGFAQEQRAGSAIRALAAMVPEHATVMRDGERLNLRPPKWCRATSSSWAVATAWRPTRGCSKRATSRSTSRR